MEKGECGKTPLLIVDDDRAVRKLLARVAERAGFEVDTAKDGVQALEMLERKQYDIAIIDLMMPRLSGYELLQKISAFAHRPTVLVATALTNSDVSTLDDSMVRRVIRKPFDINAIANALIETARDIAEKREAKPKGEPITVIAKDATIITDKASIVTDQAKLTTGPPAGAAPKPEPPETPPEPELLPPKEKIE